WTNQSWQRNLRQSNFQACIRSSGRRPRIEAPTVGAPTADVYGYFMDRIGRVPETTHQSLRESGEQTSSLDNPSYLAKPARRDLPSDQSYCCRIRWENSSHKILPGARANRV
ncbi:hypothetical protein ACCS78_21980, partial [Rhizobium johnstonii]